MTKTKRKPPRRTTVETYTGSLAELAIAATKAHRDLSWEELAARIRQQIAAPTGRHLIPDVVETRPDATRPALAGRR